MRIEVIGFRPAVLSVRDLRLNRATGRASAVIGVLVLPAVGEPPFVGSVTLGVKRSGRGDHVALLCNGCGKPCAVLHLRSGKLACATCSRHRTRRQAERTLASWNRGGREEDRLLRLVGRTRDMRLLRSLVDEIVSGDTDRARVLSELAADALRAVEDEV